MKDVFELSCTCVCVCNCWILKSLFLTIDLVRSDVNVMVYQTDQIKVSYVVKT